MNERINDVTIWKDVTNWLSHVPLTQLLVLWLFHFLMARERTLQQIKKITFGEQRFSMSTTLLDVYNNKCRNMLIKWFYLIPFRSC